MKKLLAAASLTMLSLVLTIGLQGCQPTAGPDTSAEKPLSPATLEHFKQAQNYLQERKLTEALAELQQVTKQAPESPVAHLWLGKVYLFQMNFPKSEAEFKKVLALDPKNYVAMILLGRLYSYEPKKLDLAVDYLKQGLALSPDNVEGHFDLGRVYALKGDRRKAIDSFNFVFFKERDFGLYHYEVARILEAWGEKAEALRQYQRALLFNPTLTAAQEAVRRLESRAQTQPPADTQKESPQKHSSGSGIRKQSKH
ncbi:MAG: tetratricopeptide repeat protein [Syntrophobacterales bacterium]|jgi:tetratricopeptide (TPR) repeat protein|nr:tetratricopeptide repeat protein [Syntrophobacterales bacterium]